MEAVLEATEGFRPEAVTGHASAGGLFPADVDILNTEIGAFLDVVTNHGAKLRQ